MMDRITEYHARVPVRVRNGRAVVRIECPQCKKLFIEFSIAPGGVFQNDTIGFETLRPCHDRIVVVPDDDDPYEKVCRLLGGGEYDSTDKVSYSATFGESGEMVAFTAILEEGPRAV